MYACAEYITKLLSSRSQEAGAAQVVYHWGASVNSCDLATQCAAQLQPPQRTYEHNHLHVSLCGHNKSTKYHAGIMGWIAQYSLIEYSTVW